MEETSRLQFSVMTKGWNDDTAGCLRRRNRGRRMIRMEALRY